MEIRFREKKNQARTHFFSLALCQPRPNANGYLATFHRRKTPACRIIVENFVASNNNFVET
jgi:hypothetical protein